MKKIIIDTDIGEDIDDIWALTLLISNRMFDVKMISITQGDIEYKTKIVAKILTLLNRFDILIVKGVNKGIENTIRPQLDWVKDFDINTYQGSISEDYYQSYRKIIEENLDISVLAIGPFSSLVSIIPLLRVYNIPVIAMAGSVYKGYFESNEISPECNVVTDIEASKLIFSGNLNLTILPLDVCSNIILSGNDYKEIKDSSSILSKIVIDNYTLWDKTYVGGAKKFDVEQSSSILYDLIVVFYMQYPQFFDVLKMPIYIDEQGYTRIGGNNNVYVATRIHKLNVLLQYASEQLSTNVKHDIATSKIGITNRYQLTFVLRKTNALLSTTEYGWEAKRSGGHYGPTRREYYILHFIESGKGFIQVNDKKTYLTKGECFLVPPHIPTYYEADLDDPWKYYWIGFDGLEAKELLEKIGLLVNDNYTIKVENYLSVIERIKRLMDYDDNAIEYRSLATLYDIFADMMKDSDNQEEKNREYVDNAIKYINANYSRKITVGDIANKIGIERTYLFRLFVNKMNVSPQEYLINIRIENAKILLCNTNKSIKEISLLVGYYNYVSFIKTFKERVLCSPSQYRQTSNQNKQL